MKGDGIIGRLGRAVMVAFCFLSGAGASFSQTPEPTVTQGEHDPFRSFVDGLWAEAKARGISRSVFDQAFSGLSPDSKVLALTRKQSEFSQPIWSYVAAAASPARVARGQEAARQWSAALDAIERSYGVPRTILLGIWGMETNFGAAKGSTDVIRALATLAAARYRGEFFRGELLVALDLLQAGLSRADLTGSWAGAMGHTQFMPSSYVKYRADGDGDGVSDIWLSVADALASTANYLRQNGWQPGLPWGFEVELPEGFDFRHHRHSFARWAELGVGRRNGEPMPRQGEATLFLPAGARGPAFLVTGNYDVIKSYNSSDAYALGVAHLGDLALGGPPIQARWPSDEPMLAKDHREELQKRLGALGFYSGEADGRFGSKTREAVRRFQLERGLIADGYASWAVLKELRAAR